MKRQLEDTTCATCDRQQAVAWVPGVNPDDGPLGALVIHPVCRTCLMDYLTLVEMREADGGRS